MALRCPSCAKKTLQPFTDPAVGLEIDACTECGGLWFDPRELGTFLKSDVMKERFLWMNAVPVTGVGYVINTTRRRCPRDTQVMEEKVYGGIPLDCCPTCNGLWFDEGEVRLIVERYKRGMARGDAEIGREVGDGLSVRRGGDMSGGLGGFVDFIRGLVGKT